MFKVPQRLFSLDVSSTRAVLNHRMKFVVYFAALVSTCLVAFPITASHMVVGPLQFHAPVSSVDGSAAFSPDVNLTAEVISVDPILRTIVMNWYPTMVSENCPVLDIYVPATLLDASSPSWTSGPDNTPAIRLNGTEICMGLTQPYTSFRTVTKLIASEKYLGVSQIIHASSIQSYPFDVYLAPLVFYTQNVGTGEILPLRVSNSLGIAVNFKISLANSFVDHNIVQENLTFSLLIERSTATKVFVVLVAITNWLTAVVFLIIVAAIIVYKPHEIYAEIFVVPVGSLFAFSSVRSNLPGAPAGFGAKIDMYTILPVLIIMSLCSSALLLIVLYRRIHHHVQSREQEAWRQQDPQECGFVFQVEHEQEMSQPSGHNIHSEGRTEVRCSETAGESERKIPLDSLV